MMLVGYVLNHVLNHMILGPVTMALQFDAKIFIFITLTQIPTLTKQIYPFLKRLKDYYY